MKYGDKFILKSKSLAFKCDSYTRCIFICKREDKGVIVYEYYYGFGHGYSDCLIDSEDILTREEFINEINEKNFKLKEKILFSKKILEDIKGCPCFQRSVSIIDDLSNQLKDWERSYENYIAKGGHDEKKDKFYKQILHDLRKGIKRRNKRIWQLLEKYKNIDLKYLYNIESQISNYEREIELNEKTMEETINFLDRDA